MSKALEYLLGFRQFVHDVDQEMGEVFDKFTGGTSWAHEKIMAACERATFKPLGSFASQ